MTRHPTKHRVDSKSRTSFQPRRGTTLCRTLSLVGQLMTSHQTLDCTQVVHIKTYSFYSFLSFQHIISVSRSRSMWKTYSLCVQTLLWCIRTKQPRLKQTYSWRSWTSDNLLAWLGLMTSLQFKRSLCSAICMTCSGIRLTPLYQWLSSVWWSV